MRASELIWRHVRRWLYLIHRWIGVFTCLLFVIWFMSGVVMAYVPFPALTEQERLAGQQPIAWGEVRTIPHDVLTAAPGKAPRLIMLEGKPVWLTGRDAVPISAADGRTLTPASAERAMGIARNFTKIAHKGYVGRVRLDQWTVAGSFDAARPFWRVGFDDPAGTVVHVSARTSQVALVTTRSERAWNWVGSIPHWIYFTVIRQDQPMWRQVILWVAGVGIAGATTGMWIGILRMRLTKRYRGGRVSPYRGWQKWHHIAGLIGGVTLTTWIISGWLSVDPNRWFASAGLPDTAYQAYAGPPGHDDLANIARLARLPQAAGMTELRVRRVAGQALLDLRGPDTKPVLLDAASLKPAAFSNDTLIRTVRGMLPGVPLAGIDRLDREDNYYYSADGSRALPVLRLRFADPAGHWFYVNPGTAEIAFSADRTDRLYRWLFDALHCLDFGGFSAVRPAWDVLLWALSCLGLIVSASGVVIGWRRLKPTYPRQSGSIA